MRIVIATSFVLLCSTISLADDAEFFEREVRPILVGTCLRCHGPDKHEGGLRLDSREAILKGGESGPAMMPKEVDASRIVKAIRYDSDELKMPPSSKMPDKEIAAITEWIRRGAPWPESSGARLTVPHWAFQPVKPVALPEDPASNPIDKFVNVALRQHGLTPVGRADKITLIRRATFDLTGLPPNPDDVASFLADESPDAFARVVERLLASKHYGEKWGRHWLDVVRYADTAGETADFPAPHAWRYRNYVIDALNNDKPYDQFLREQLAGDILAQRLPPDAPREQYAELVTATGYLAISRRFGFDISKDQFLTIEDTIDTLGKSVLGMTLACARCHDHKYDPITAADYYGLYGIFESTRYPFPGCEKVKTPRDMVPLVPPAEFQRRLAELDEELNRVEREKVESDKRLAELIARPASVTINGEIPNGGSQEFSAGTGAESLARLTLKAGEILQLSILPKNGHGADSTRVELEITEIGGKNQTWNVTRDMLAAANEQANPSTAPSNPKSVPSPQSPVLITWSLFDLVPAPTPLTTFIRDAEKTKGLFVWRGAGDTPSAFVNSNDHEIKFITVTLPPKSFGLHPGPQGGVAVAWTAPEDMTVRVNGLVTDADATGGDGIAWRLEQRPGIARELSESRVRTVARNEAKQRRDSFEQTLDKAYAVLEGDPHDAQLHHRGDPENRGDPVRRHFPASLGGHEIPPDSGSGRLALAGWLASPTNPLTARVMVNRIWQHHFGTGLVSTPNDFGVRGTPPSHPELLDWLAGRFVADGWSLKQMHRLITSSDAYQRSSVDEPQDFATDPSNVWLWKFSRRRLSAEELRDTILSVSGDLDPTPGGAHPFPPESSWGFTQHGPFLAVYDHDKRSVYLMTQRIKRHPFLALFDGADSNTSTPDRFSTIVPTQALFFLNDPFVHTKSEHMAARLMSLPNDAARVDRTFRLMFSHAPTDEQLASAARFVADYTASLPNGSLEEKNRQAWAAYVRVLMSSNEFSFVD
jgi:Protein of unknown function (DUF1553)/Protein of unknown function (DUF1549)/Planctomycete cytochrome C